MEHNFEHSLHFEFDTDITEPEQTKVVLLNDDFTTKEFVVHILTVIFHKNNTDAVQIMEDVHNSGRGIVGVYTYDIAITRIEQVHTYAQMNGFPLRCTLESV